MSDCIAELLGAQATSRLLSVSLRIVIDQVRTFRRLTIGNHFMSVDTATGWKVSMLTARDLLVPDKCFRISLGYV